MSAQNIAILTLSVKATAAVAARRFVTPSGAQSVAAANALGVSQCSGVAGEMIPVDVLGTAVVEAGAAFAAGVALETDASGRAVAKAAGPAVARATQAATQAGDLIEVFLIPN